VGSSFAEAKKGLIFFEKGDVNGPKARGVYKFVKEATKTPEIGWNFGIFLVDKSGTPKQYFEPSRTPYDDIKPVLEKLMA